MTKKLFQVLLLCLLCPMMGAAQGWDEAKYRQIEQSIRVPQFADAEFLITKYGAKPTNTAAQNQKAHTLSGICAARAIMLHGS